MLRAVLLVVPVVVPRGAAIAQEAARQYFWNSWVAAPAR